MTDQPPSSLHLSYTEISLSEGADEGVAPPDPTVRVKCRRKEGFRWVSESSGAVIPARCGSNGCEDCAPVNAVVAARAIHHARPERLITLTGVGYPWARAQRQMQSLRQRLRRRGLEVEWCWTVEANPRETGHHLHAAQHGSFIPQAMLSESAASVGMGEVAWIERARTGPQGAHYGLKGALYPMKGASDPGAALWSFLDVNGGRLHHHTRGFFRDGPGGKMLTAVEARRRAMPRGEDEGPWRLLMPGVRVRSAADPSTAES